MKKVAFTICTYSYVGIANALKNSFLEYNSDYDFVIVLADWYDKADGNNLISCKQVMAVSDEKFAEMAFKYNIAEFCTSIKPHAFSYFFGKQYDLAVYLDPDILFYSKLGEVRAEEKYSVYLTPHITKMMPSIENEWKQESFLKYGIFNCGFVALRNDETGKKISNWWSEILKDKAFSDEYDGLYTDQKWMDIIFSFIDIRQIKIISDIGYDVAPWNYSERKILNDQNEIIVVDRENEQERKLLCFVHYSAYNYKKLAAGETYVEPSNANHAYEDSYILSKIYSEKLLESDALSKLDIKYEYGTFDNDQPISPFVRRVYRAFVSQGKHFDNPFRTDENSFYKLLKKKKLLEKIDISTAHAGQIRNYEKKNKVLKKIMKMLFCVLGVGRYVQLLRKMRELSRFENNYFLLD